MSYEKGSAAWDIGMILTVHRALGPFPCEKVAELIRTVGQGASDRVVVAWQAPCTCHAGEGAEQHTSDPEWMRA